jgi:hypothetical protein
MCGWPINGYWGKLVWSRVSSKYIMCGSMWTQSTPFIMVPRSLYFIEGVNVLFGALPYNYRCPLLRVSFKRE